MGDDCENRARYACKSSHIQRFIDFVIVGGGGGSVFIIAVRLEEETKIRKLGTIYDGDMVF